MYGLSQYLIYKYQVSFNSLRECNSDDDQKPSRNYTKKNCYNTEMTSYMTKQTAKLMNFEQPV